MLKMKLILMTLQILSSVHYCFCLYEDQAGKFDWQERHIGVVKASAFDPFEPRKFAYVATEGNVIASLRLTDGSIAWRKVLETGERGHVEFLRVHNNILFAITGRSVIQVRGWETRNGLLTHAWSLATPAAYLKNDIFWYFSENNLNMVIVDETDDVKIITYQLFNGEYLGSRNFTFHKTGDSFKCAVKKHSLGCYFDEQLSLADLEDPSIPRLNATLNRFQLLLTSLKPSASPYGVGFAVTHTKARSIAWFDITTRSAKITEFDSRSTDSFVYRTSNEDVTCILTAEEGAIRVEMNVGNASKAFVYQKKGAHDYEVEIVGGYCNESSSGPVTCFLLVSCQDGSLLYLSVPGSDFLWIREEALASIVTVEMIELPMSETETEMQTEFESRESDMFKRFVRRLSNHFSQAVKSLSKIPNEIGKILGVPKGMLPEADLELVLVRDKFNLHKLIIVITKQMKIFAIDSLSGKILWSYVVRGLKPFPPAVPGGEPRISLFIQRTNRHYPFSTLCTIIGTDASLHNSYALSFEPTSGEFDAPQALGYRVKQAMTLPKATADEHLYGIVLMDEHDVAHVYPTNATSVAKDMANKLYFFVADSEYCSVRGYAFDPESENMLLNSIWNMRCAGKIIKIAGKNPIEKVHSQGRVMGDRSVLYKYLNPNLIAVVSKDINPADGKDMLTLYFVDSVTGVVIDADVRHRATEPVHLVHSENWVVLMYFSEKARRTEIVSYELYEGKNQINSNEFSSLEAKNFKPIIDSKAYIFPNAHIVAAKETITEKGITLKQVLIATSTGRVVELPWIILDPRRPLTVTPEMKEEGVIPYMPELMVPTESMINYNQTLYNVQGIHTSPSGLESTCLIFIYGLDLFYTKTSPSKQFDVLKEDFEYMFIVIVLTILIAATVITKRLAHRKALKQAWH